MKFNDGIKEIWTVNLEGSPNIMEETVGDNEINLIGREKFNRRKVKREWQHCWQRAFQSKMIEEEKDGGWDEESTVKHPGNSSVKGQMQSQCVNISNDK